MIDDFCYLSCYTGTVENQKLYVVNVLYGILLEYNLEDFSYKVITRLSLPDVLQAVRVNSIIKVENKFYMILNNSWNVFLYDMDLDKWTVFGNECDYKDGLDIVRKAFLYQNKIWLIPYKSNSEIRIFDLEAEKFHVGKTVNQYVIESGFEKDLEDYTVVDEYFVENTIWIAFRNTPYVVSINLKNDICQSYIVDSEKRIFSLTYSNDQYWISFANTNIVANWHPDKGVIGSHVLENSSVDGVYRSIYASEKKLVVVPSRNNNIHLLDFASKDQVTVPFSKNFKRVFNELRAMFYESIRIGNKVVLLPFSTSEFIVVDLENGEVKSYSCRLRNKDVGRYYMEGREINKFLLERDVFDVEHYVMHTRRNDFEDKDELTIIGSEIWNYFRDGR